MKTFYCSNCNKTYAVQDDLPDEKMVCPNCDNFIIEESKEENNIISLSHENILSEQFKSIRRIEGMMKFFVILTAINIIATIIGAISIANLF